MGDWFLNLPILWMALAIFAAAYLVAACVYLVTVRLAVADRARAFKAFSPGMLPPLGIIFGLLVGFVAVGVWNDFDKAKLAVATEASALRAVVLLDGTFPAEQRTHLRTLVNRHIDEAVLAPMIVRNFRFVSQKRTSRHSTRQQPRTRPFP